MNKELKPTLADVVSAIDSGLNELIRKVSKLNSGNIVIGYNQLLYRSSAKRIRNHLSHLNEFVRAYQGLFPGSNLSEDLLDEILNMNLDDPCALELELKKRYMKFHKVQIPNFPFFKLEKLIEIYEYPQKDLDLLAAVVASAGNFGSTVPKHHGWTADYWRYYSKTQGEFVLSEAQDRSLLESFTVYTSDEDLSEIISLHLLSRSLTDLSPAYSLRDLPEIDFRILPLLQRSDDAVSLNLEKIKEIRGGLKPGHDLDIEI